MKCKNLTDVVLTMYNCGYDLIAEDIKTIGSNGIKRTCLLFQSFNNNIENEMNIKETIGTKFTCEKYNDGKYYQVYRTL